MKKHMYKELSFCLLYVHLRMKVFTQVNKII